MFFYIFFGFLLLLASYFSYKIFVADMRRRIIPDVYLFPLMLIGLVLVTFYQWPITPIDATIGATFGYLTAIIIGLIFDWKIKSKDKNAITPIGMGDIKLISIGGMWLGTTGLAIALIIACITGLFWGKKKKQRYLPFAPFFLIGAILTLIGTAFLL